MFAECGTGCRTCQLPGKKEPARWRVEVAEQQVGASERPDFSRLCIVFRPAAGLRQLHQALILVRCVHLAGSAWGIRTPASGRSSLEGPCPSVYALPVVQPFQSCSVSKPGATRGRRPTSADALCACASVSMSQGLAHGQSGKWPNANCSRMCGHCNVLNGRQAPRYPTATPVSTPA